MFKRNISNIIMTLSQLYCFVLFKTKVYQRASRLTYNQQKSKNSGELPDTNCDFDEEVTKQNKALLEIINKTINNVPVVANELDIKKELEKEKHPKLDVPKK
jgi:hypothetical protein